MVEATRLDSNTQTPSEPEFSPSVLLRVWLQIECSPRNARTKKKEVRALKSPNIALHGIIQAASKKILE